MDHITSSGCIAGAGLHACARVVCAQNSYGGPKSPPPSGIRHPIFPTGNLQFGCRMPSGIQNRSSSVRGSLKTTPYHLASERTPTGQPNSPRCSRPVRWRMPDELHPASAIRWVSRRFVTRPVKGQIGVDGGCGGWRMNRSSAIRHPTAPKKASTARPFHRPRTDAGWAGGGGPTTHPTVTQS